MLEVALFIYYWVWDYQSKVCGDVCATCEAINHTIGLHFVNDAHDIFPTCCSLEVVMFIKKWVWGR